MNEQTPIHEPKPFDRREARRDERLANSSHGNAWVAGVILILLGTMFLMRNLGTFEIPLKNWWALFILIPAFGAFDKALRIYRSAGNHLHAEARSSLLAGLVLTFITGMFLFDISWTYFGPILIILAGLGILVNSAFSEKN